MKKAKLRTAILPITSVPGRKTNNRRPITPGQGIRNLMLESGGNLMLESGGVIVSESKIKQLIII